MEEKLRRAFQLAFFILGEEQAALRATREAVALLEAALAAQDKRIYYASASRTKVSLSEWQMLQRLVYIAAEPEEQRQEAAQSLPRAALLIRYLKHLARITLKRNSFFVTLGVSRLLHNYSTPETMQIYGLIVQDPARARDDSYYRRRKAQLMQEIGARFGALLVVERGARGEERFQTAPDKPCCAALALDCLNRFTPWETSCGLPAAFDPWQDELPLLRFRGRDPDGEHKVEARRLHVVLHPDCFARMTAALRLDAPAARLALPQFHTADGQPPAEPPDGPRPTAHLSEEAMQSLKDYLAQQRERRRRASPVWLRVLVDGVESARWSLAQSSNARLVIAPHAELIEVYGAAEGEEVRLAAHLLNYDADGQLRPETVVLTLASGQQLTFTIEPQYDSAGASVGAAVAAQYRATAPLRVWWARLFGAVRQDAAPGWRWRPKLAFTLLAVCLAGLAGLLYFLFADKRRPPQPEIAQATPSPAASLAPVASPSIVPPPSPLIAPPSPVAPPPDETVLAIDLRSRVADGFGNLTRGERAASAATALRAGQQLYLIVTGAPALSRSFTAALKQHLGGRFQLTESADDAEAALKLDVRAAAPSPSAAPRIRVTAHVASKNGKVIWPLTPRSRDRQYSGAAERVAARLGSDLLNDARSLPTKTK